MLRVVWLSCGVVLAACLSSIAQDSTNRLTGAEVSAAGKVLGLGFSDDKVDMALPGLEEQLRQYNALRAFPLSNSVPPAILFNPIPVGAHFNGERRKPRFTR